MAMKFVLLSAIVLVNFVYSNAFAYGGMCGENEQFLSCASPSPRTCDNYQEKQVRTMMCLPGCECLAGYVFNKSGQCVPETECEQSREKRSASGCAPKSKNNSGRKPYKPSGKVRDDMMNSLMGN